MLLSSVVCNIQTNHHYIPLNKPGGLCDKDFVNVTKVAQNSTKYSKMLYCMLFRTQVSKHHL